MRTEHCTAEGELWHWRFRSIDTCVLGRKTYDLSVSFGMAGRLHREEELRVLAHAVESRHQ
jgi:hypothetical protein